MTDPTVSTRAILISTALFACLTTMAPGARAGSSLTLTVRLYNTAHIPTSSLVVARHTAEAMFRDTGLNVIVRVCGQQSSVDPVDSCSESLKPAEFVVRVIDAPAFNPMLHPEAFGVAYVVKETNRGWLATVFADRIGGAAGRLGVDADTLLGLVIAHELGHLLLGVGYHGETGVMRAEWPDQLLTSARGAWHFSPLEAEAMREAAVHF